MLTFIQNLLLAFQSGADMDDNTAGLLAFIRERLGLPDDLLAGCRLAHAVHCVPTVGPEAAAEHLGLSLDDLRHARHAFGREPERYAPRSFVHNVFLAFTLVDVPVEKPTPELQDALETVRESLGLPDDLLAACHVAHAIYTNNPAAVGLSADALKSAVA